MKSWFTAPYRTLLCECDGNTKNAHLAASIYLFFRKMSQTTNKNRVFYIEYLACGISQL